MDYSLLEILACPLCKGKLVYNQEMRELVCHFDQLAYPVRDNIPILLVEEAHALKDQKG